MNEDEQLQYAALAQQAQSEQLRRMTVENQMTSMSGFNAGKEPNIIEYQLDVSPILDRIYHALSGHTLEIKNNREIWVEPKDDRLKILSDYGVKQIMNLLAMYISPNTLLSNFDEMQINQKTHSFGEELCDLIFCRYEHFFYYPSPEELYEKYSKIAKEHNIAVNETELYYKCVQWSNEELSMKFRHYPMLVISLVETVNNALLRALKGEERRSLRRQINIHETLNANPVMQSQQRNKFNPFNLIPWK